MKYDLGELKVRSFVTKLSEDGIRGGNTGVCAPPTLGCSIGCTGDCGGTGNPNTHWQCETDTTLAASICNC